MKLIDLDISPPTGRRIKNTIGQLMCKRLNRGWEDVCEEDISCLDGVTIYEMLELRQVGEKTAIAALDFLRAHGVRVGSIISDIEVIEAMSTWT